MQTLLKQIEDRIKQATPTEFNDEYSALLEYRRSGAHIVNYATREEAEAARALLNSNLQKSRNQIGYVHFAFQKTEYKILNLKANLERFYKAVKECPGFKPPRAPLPARDPRRIVKASIEKASAFINANLKLATPEDVANAVEMALLHGIEETVSKNLI